MVGRRRSELASGWTSRRDAAVTERKRKGAKKRPKASRKKKPENHLQLPVVIDAKPEPPHDETPKDDRRPLDAAAFEDFCVHIGLGNSLRSWAEKEGWSPAAIVKWVQQDPERTKLYREARKMQADSHIDGLIELADEAVPVNDFGSLDSAAVNNKRLRIDTRKWIAAKYHPALYGEKVDITASANLGALPPDQIMQRVVALFATHGLRVVPESTNGSDEHS